MRWLLCLLVGHRPARPIFGFVNNGHRVWVIERCERCGVVIWRSVDEDVSEDDLNDPHVDIQIGPWTSRIGKPV